MVIEGIVDKNDASRAVQLGVGGLAKELGVLGVDLAVKHTVLIELLRLVPQNQHQLVLYVQAGVIVIAVFRRGNAITGKNHPGRDFAARGEVERNELFARLQCGRLAVLRIFELIAGAKFGIGRDRKGLEITLAIDGLQPDMTELARNVIRRFLELGGAGGSAAHLRRREILDVAQKALGIDVRRCEGRGRRGGKRREQHPGQAGKPTVDTRHSMIS